MMNYHTDSLMLKEPLEYLEWKKGMLRLLEELDLDSCLLPTSPKQNKRASIFRKIITSKSDKDARAKLIIQSHVSAQLTSRIDTAETAAAAWAELAGWFNTHSQNVLEKKRKEMNAIKLEQFKSVRQFNNAFKLAIKEMRALGEPIPIQNVIIRYIYATESLLPMWAARVKMEARCIRNYYTEARFEQLMKEVKGEGEENEFFKAWLEKQKRAEEPKSEVFTLERDSGVDFEKIEFCD